MRLEVGRTQLAVIDVQEAFAPAVLEFEKVVKNVATLVEAAGIIGIPVVLSEQYPKGLGKTVESVREKLNGIEPVEKVCFSAFEEDEFRKQISNNSSRFFCWR